MNWKTNKQRAIYRDTSPTLTDQSQAEETNINVIVKRYAVTGAAPGAAGEPLYGDWTQLPGGLRDMIEASRDIKELRKKLPKELAELPVTDLLKLSPADIERILAPPAPTPEPTEEKK